MYSCTAQLHRDLRGREKVKGDGAALYLWIEDFDGCLERFEEPVLVRKHAKLAGLDTNADAGRDVVLCALEPRVALGLRERSQIRRYGKNRSARSPA